MFAHAGFFALGSGRPRHRSRRQANPATNRPQSRRQPMSLLRPQRGSSLPRASGVLNVKGWVILWCSLVAVILLTQLPFPFPSEPSLDAHGCTLTDLLAHLQKGGLQL